MNQKHKRLAKTILIVLILLTLCFIWGNSLLDREESSEMSNGLLDSLRPFLEAIGIHIEDDFWLRDLAHVAEFGALGIELSLLFLLEKGRTAATAGKAVLLSLLAAVTDELLQMLNDRASQLVDVGLDVVGACLGIGLIFLITHAVMKRPE